MAAILRGNFGRGQKAKFADLVHVEDMPMIVGIYDNESGFPFGKHGLLRMPQQYDLAVDAKFE